MKTNVLNDYKLPKGHVLVMKSLPKDLKAYNGFKWPKSGKVEAKDFLPTKECGCGLHGFLWGAGSANHACWDDDAKWIVIRVKNDKNLIDLGDKVKFKSGVVVYCGDRMTATNLVRLFAPNQTKIIGGIFTSGNKGQSTSGDNGQSTSGYNGQSTSSDNGQSTSGDNGQSTSGDNGQSTSGDNGQSTSGYNGQSTSGEHGLSVAKRGRCRSGKNGIVAIQWWSEKKKRYYLVVGHVGEKGIKADTWYKCNEKGKLVEVKP